MDKKELYEKCSVLMTDEEIFRSRKLRKDKIFSEEVQDRYRLAHRHDEIALELLQFLIQMDDKMDEILSRLS